jgi:hypothetical protein
LRTPTSRARPDDRAVARLTKLATASRRMNKDTAVKMRMYLMSLLASN